MRVNARIAEIPYLGQDVIFAKAMTNFYLLTNLTKPALDRAMQLAKGDIKSLSERRGIMVDKFAKLGITKERLAERVGKQSIEEITLDDLQTLTGCYNALKDGEAAVDDIFPATKKEAPKANPFADRENNTKSPEKEEVKDSLL